jgi:hypothetical protein
VKEDTVSDEAFSGGAFGELRRTLSNDSMTVVPVPALSVVLAFVEQQKGSALTEDEVLAALETAPAITMTTEDAARFAERPGVVNLNPDNIWHEWQAFRAAQIGNDG